MENILKDDRFTHITTDPRFKRIPKKERKVKIDKRFQSMFKDEKFNVKYTVDKRGRPVQYAADKDLKKYYELSSDSETSDSDEESENKTKQEVGKFVRPLNDSLDEPKADNKVISELVKKKLSNLKVDYARGEDTLFSESSSDDESSTEEVDEETVEHDWGELDKDAETTDMETNRLAICNMDWDRIKAIDLMVLFNSFLPTNGLIKSITIYPSDFGLQRMKEEEIKGPQELIETKKEELSENEDEENEEGSKYQREKLRKYQLNRLKYYYAVMVCDSPSTANKIYTECDGLEYESSGTKLDLRFIPDEEEFTQESKEVCDRLPDLSKYKPRYFTTTALQQAKVELTWDETNPDRAEFTQKLNSGKVDDISEADLQTYLAVSSEDDEDENEQEQNLGSNSDSEITDPIEKYRMLLQDIESKEQNAKKDDVEMEITWGADLQQKTENIIKKKSLQANDLTPFEQFLEKRREKKKTKKTERLKNKEKTDSNSGEDEFYSDDDIPSDIDMNDPYFTEEFNKKEFKKPKNKKKNKYSNDEDPEEINKKAELELLLMNEEDSNRNHFSLAKIQKSENESIKKKKKNKFKKKETETKHEDDFKINTNDERFSAIFSSHHYNIDPADPHYKKTKAMETLIEEKMKRRLETLDYEKTDKSKKVKTEQRDILKKDTELNVLIKSVKRKTEAYKNK